MKDGYCIFHVPKHSQRSIELMSPTKQQEAKGVEAIFQIEFKKLVDQIENDIAIKEYNFRGFKFPPITLSKMSFGKPVSLLGAVFTDSADFSSAFFGDYVDFHKTKFYGTATFTKAIFCGDANFLDVEFRQSTDFSAAEFKQQPTFMKCHFGALSSFSQAVFKKGVKFSYVRFNTVGFIKTTFDGETVFEGDTDRECFYGVAELSSLRVPGEATISFDHVSLGHVTFLDTNLEKFGFRAVRWYAPKGRPYRKNALWDEFRPQVSDRTYPHVGENYAQLVINYEKRRDYEIAEDFHIGEMEVRRKTKEGRARRNKWRKHFAGINSYRLYRVLSSYGTSYWRALAVFVLIFLVCSWSLLLQACNLPSKIPAL